MLPFVFRTVNLQDSELHLSVMAGCRNGSQISEKGQSLWRSRVAVAAIVAGVSMCCILALLCTNGWLLDHQIASFSHESQEWVDALRTDVVSQSEKIIELQMQVRELSKELWLARKEQCDARKRLLALGEQLRVGPFGTVKSLKTSPTIIPDESVNPRLAKLLGEVAIRKELIVALANTKVEHILEIWLTSIKKVGITNYLVVALDDEIAEFCKSNEVRVYQRDPDQEIDTLGKTGGPHTVSSLKFRILREFLQLGYSVLLSDVDVVYLQNPFDHLYRDSDVESMTDGHDNRTAYGYNDKFDEPVMGWSHIVYTNRIWVYNSGFFYIRPTIPSIELLDRVAGRLSRERGAWDQAVFNEELFCPSHPGYEGLHITKRTMDYYLFMNSKVLFRMVRKDAKLSQLKPVIVHLNYHLDKLARMKAVLEFYVNGNKDALRAFPDGSQ